MTAILYGRKPGGRGLARLADDDTRTATAVGAVLATFQLQNDYLVQSAIDGESDELDESDVVFLAAAASGDGQSARSLWATIDDEVGDVDDAGNDKDEIWVPSSLDGDDDTDDEDDDFKLSDNDDDIVDERRLANILIPLMHSSRRIVKRPRVQGPSSMSMDPSTTVTTTTTTTIITACAEQRLKRRLQTSNLKSPPVIAVSKAARKMPVVMFGRRPLSKRKQAELRRRARRKAPPVFAEITVPLFSDSQFRSCFRISRRACEALTRRLVPQILQGMVGKDNPIKSGRPPIALDKKVLIVLWFFANAQPLRAISERFEVAKSSVEDSFRRVITALVEIAGEYVRWPTGDYAQEVMEQFRELSGLPGILGALGTAHFTIKNKETPKIYADANGPSISVQFVCDHQMLITDCFGGLPGSISDVSAFRKSDLHTRILTDYATLFPSDSYLIGGPSLPVEPWLMTPYSTTTSYSDSSANAAAAAVVEDNDLSPAKLCFNRCVQLALGVMHRTVALLKGRFTRLQLLEMNRVDFMPLCVSAACVLHNACLIEDEREVDNVQEYVDAGWESTIASISLGHSATVTATTTTETNALLGGGSIDEATVDSDRWLLGCRKRNLLCNALLLSDEAGTSDVTTWPPAMHWLLVLGFVLFVVDWPLVSATGTLQDAVRRPNIVFVLADDLGWNDVSFHGSMEILTPNIDALAFRGVILNNYYVTPICSPSRSAILTGKHPIHTGMQVDVIMGPQPYGLGLDEKIMPQHFNDLGYVSHLIGKWHQGFFKDEYTPTRRGFASHFGYYCGHQDYYFHTTVETTSMIGFDMHRNDSLAWDTVGNYTTQLFTEEAVRIIEEHDKSKPLLLFLAHLAVHAGNADDPIQPPPLYERKFEYIEDPNRRRFAGVLTSLDESVGNVTMALNASGLLSNSIVVFTTDNGGAAAGFNGNAASNWPLKGTKDTLWEGGVRGSAMIWSPLLEDTVKSRVSTDLMSIEDWLPTLYSAAGGQVSDLGTIDGLDVWPSILGTVPSPRNEVLHNIDDVRNVSAIRVGHFKLVSGRTYDGRWDGWFGPPQMTVSLRLQAEKSAIETVLDGLTPLNSELPSVLRKRATVQCVNDSSHENEVGRRTTSDCVSKPCVFDVGGSDPCEFHDLADERPDLVETLMSRVEQLRSTAVTPRNRPPDPAANPTLHGYAWRPWM